MGEAFSDTSRVGDTVMISKLVILQTILVVAFQVSCGVSRGHEKENGFAAYEPARSQMSPSPERSFITDMERAAIENVVYSTVLRSVFYGGDDKDRHPDFVLDSMTGRDDWLNFRAKTIPPRYLEEIPDEHGISAAVISDLDSIGNAEKTMRNAYDVELVAKPVPGDMPIDELFRVSTSRFPKTKAVVSFSRVGLDPDGLQALVFVEYYSEAKGLIELYYILSLERRENGSKSELGVHVSNKIVAFRINPS